MGERGISPYPGGYNPHSDPGVPQMQQPSSVLPQREWPLFPPPTTDNQMAPPSRRIAYDYSEGFEGFLVPNPWFGILPWGAEGVLIVVTALTIILTLLGAIIYLFLKIIKLGILLKREYSQQEQQRSFTSKSEYLTFHVLESLDKFGGINGGEGE